MGYLCWAWIEEAYEIMTEADFDTIDESIRGSVPAPLWKQFTLTFNPWNERHWIKHRFFDDFTGYDIEGNKQYKPRPTPLSADGEILAITTNYLCNEWLDEADRRVFERMKENNPRRYAVAGLGGWGVVDGLVYEKCSRCGKEQPVTPLPKANGYKLSASTFTYDGKAKQPGRRGVCGQGGRVSCGVRSDGSFRRGGGVKEGGENRSGAESDTTENL